MGGGRGAGEAAAPGAVDVLAGQRPAEPVARQSPASGPSLPLYSSFLLQQQSYRDADKAAR